MGGGPASGLSPWPQIPPPCALGHHVSVPRSSPARAVPGGAPVSPLPTLGFFPWGGLGGLTPPPVILCQWKPLQSPMGGGTPPPPHPSAASPKAATVGGATPRPALVCPPTALPQPPSWGRGGGHCGPPSLQPGGYPDPRGVGLVPGCPPALVSWGLSGRVWGS